MKVKTSAFALDFQNVTIFDFLRYLRDNVYLGIRFGRFMREENHQDAWFTPSPIFRGGTFETFVNQFEWIKEVELETSHYEVPEDSFRSLKDQAQRHVQKFKFYKNRQWNLRRIKNAIINIFNEQQAEDLTVEGTIGGVEAICSLANDVEVFYEQEYEDWIDNLRFSENVRSNTVNSSQTIQDLIRIYEETLPVTRLDERDPMVV